MYSTEEWVDHLLVHAVERALKHAAERWAHVAYDQYRYCCNQVGSGQNWSIRHNDRRLYWCSDSPKTGLP